MPMDLQADALVRALARIRAERGVSLRELARRARVAPASLSAIEGGKCSPTLATMSKLLRALDLEFADLLPSKGTEPPSPVFARGRMRTIRDARRRMTFLFPRRRDFRFEMLHEAIAPEKTSEWESFRFDIGFVVIAGGPLLLQIEHEGEWTLREGDACYIRARRRHRGINIGRAPVELITVADPPRY
jgi:transcriptional regulator with XRE-family HTH domain